MRTTAMATTLVLVLGAGAAGAQDPERPAAVPADEAAQDEEARPVPRHRIRVLEHPYDLAGFYRQREGAGFFSGASERYPIASFYRSRQTSPYSAFWSYGYRARDGRGRALRFRRSIGENGDLYLLAPVILGPVGPLTDVFSIER
jgi:hypothetical protein